LESFTPSSRAVSAAAACIAGAAASIAAAVSFDAMLPQPGIHAESKMHIMIINAVARLFCLPPEFLCRI
jgi:hypothetical protein